MKKSLLIIGLLGFIMPQAREILVTPPDGKVGINTESPTQELDVEGNARVRKLLDGSSITDFPRYVVTKTDGTLGYLARPADKVVVKLYDHTATGLKWNTKNKYERNATQPDPDDPLNKRNISTRPKTHAGVQDNYTYYLIFGGRSDNNASSGKWTNGNTRFEAKAKDILNVSANINVSVFENFADGVPLISLSPNGDRQIIITLYLYKGTDIVAKTKKVINFNGRNDATVNDAYPYIYDSKYEDHFTQNISLNYVVPDQDGDSDNYSVSVTLGAKAPEDGQFRIDATSSDRKGDTPRAVNLRQQLVVTRL